MSSESDIVALECANASTSILDVPSFIRNHNKHSTNTTNENVEQENDNTNTKKLGNANLFAIDHIFIPYTMYLPKVFFNIASKTDNCAFKYMLSDTNTVRIEGDELLKEYFIYEYGKKFQPPSNSIFMYNKKRFIRQFNSEEKRNFKKSIEEKEKYKQSDYLKEYKEFIYNSQIKHGFNIFYVEDYDDLLSIFKVLVGKKKEDAVRAKKFDVDMQKERLEYVLKNVPGISKNVAKSMCIRFGSLFEFVIGLNEMEKEYFIDLPVVLDDGISTRKLTEREYAVMERVFISTDPTELVLD